MTKAPMRLQDRQRKIYGQAKAAPSWRFWGLYVHVGTMETLREAYGMAKANNGAPGIDGVTFEAIEASGVQPLREQIQPFTRNIQESAVREIRTRRVTRRGLET